MTITHRIEGDSSSIVVFDVTKVQTHTRTKDRTKQWLFLDVMASLQLLDYPQSTKNDNFVY